MAKVIRKSNKASHKRANKKTLKKTSKNRKSNSRSKVMRGGDDGRFVLPPSYFGGNTNGYVSNFETLSGAVSQGTVTKNGLYAGPNLYPYLGVTSGGGCGCGGKKSKSKSKTQNKLNIKQKKSRKSKSKNNKRH